MINLLLGAPGGGKSYEAVAYHVIPALAQGRKVITNLPLQVDEIAAFEPAAQTLVELVTATKAKRPEGEAGNDWRPVAFAHLEDYGDPWRHPDTGAGPLYVIDEAHIPLPVKGTPRAVEEWYSLHRHESADVLLITQSYGKLNRAVRDLVQVVYRVRKNVAFGSANSYVRKVQDGLRGDVVNTSVRTYQKRFFKFYRSHTRGGGSELQARDIVPLWQRWPFIALALMVPAFIWVGSTWTFNPMGMVHTPEPKLPAPHVEAHRAGVEAARRANQAVPQPSPGAAAGQAEPDAGPGPRRQPRLVPPHGETEMMIEGYIHAEDGTRTLYLLAAAQNGQVIYRLTSSDLEALGWQIAPQGPCALRMAHGEYARALECGKPQIGVPLPGLGGAPAGGEGSQNLAARVNPS